MGGSSSSSQGGSYERFGPTYCDGRSALREDGVEDGVEEDADGSTALLKGGQLEEHARVAEPSRLCSLATGCVEAEVWRLDFEELSRLLAY